MTIYLGFRPAFLLESRLLPWPTQHRTAEPANPDGHDHIVRVRVVGELDLQTAPRLRDELLSASRGHTNRASWAEKPAIQLDLTGLSFLDLQGISTLAASHRALLGLGCLLCITDPQPAVQRLLELAVRLGWLPAEIECVGHRPWPAAGGPTMGRERSLYVVTEGASAASSTATCSAHPSIAGQSR